MSAQKGKSSENSQRANSLVRSNSNSGSKPRSNSKKQVEERKNEIKRKLLEQMQADLRQHPEGQAKTYEALDNAKKLKKMLVDSIYQNRDPLYNLIHNQQLHHNNNSNSNINNSHNNIHIQVNNLNQNSSSTLKVVKTNQLFNGQQLKGNNIKQRSSSVQKEYSSNKNDQQPHYSHLNCIPNDQQSKSNNTSYRQLYNMANSAFQDQQSINELNERQTLNGKKQVTFTDPSLRKNQNRKSSSSPKHQCFHKEGCPKHQHSNHHNDGEFINCTDGQEIHHQCQENAQYLQETGKFGESVNEECQENTNNEQNQRGQSNHIRQNNQEITVDQKREGFSTVKIGQNSSAKKNGSERNSLSPYDRDQSSTQKQIRSYSASNSAKKQGYQNLIESEEEKLEILKKIQNQKDQIAAGNRNIVKDNEIISSDKKQTIPKDKSTASSSRKPPAPHNLSSQISSSASIQNKTQFDNNSKQALKTKPNNNNNNNTNKQQQDQEKKDTLQKQRSVSTQQYTHTNSKGIQNNARSTSKGRIEGSQNQDKSLKFDEQNMSFEGDNTKREQKIIDLQKMIERMKVENSNRLNNLEIKKLGEQMEKDKLYEKQILELKQQQKTIFLLQQEKDILQDQCDSFENKFKQIQNRNKFFEKQKIEYEDEIQRQLIIIQELKSQINESKGQYNDLNKRQQILKKQYDDLEIEKNKINNQKQRMENDAQQKSTQYQCMNKQNLDLTIEFERKNKESQYQINQLIEKVNSITKKYEESSKNEAIYEKKFKAESQAKEQLRVELKLIQAQVSENEELKRKLKQKENKLEELESVIDDLKRKIRNNLDIDMKNHPQNRQMIEKIVEKPVFIEKKVEVERSSHNSNLAQEYKAQMIKCQQDISEIKRSLMQEQELHHQKVLECETWRNHAFQLEDKLRNELNMLQQNFDMERDIFDKDLREKENHIKELQSKISTLLLEIESLTHKNIDKNRQIANEIINSNSVLQINDNFHQIPNYFQSSQNVNNQSYISYIH